MYLCAIFMDLEQPFTVFHFRNVNWKLMNGFVKIKNNFPNVIVISFKTCQNLHNGSKGMVGINSIISASH